MSKPKTDIENISRLTVSQPVRIHVGTAPHNATYYINVNGLILHSPYLSRLISQVPIDLANDDAENENEGTSTQYQIQHLDLPDILPEEFIHFTRWAVTDPQISENGAATRLISFNDLNEIVTAYLIAHRFEVEEMKNDVVDAARRYYAQNSREQIDLRAVVRLARTFPPSSNQITHRQSQPPREADDQRPESKPQPSSRRDRERKRKDEPNTDSNDDDPILLSSTPTPTSPQPTTPPTPPIQNQNNLLKFLIDILAYQTITDLFSPIKAPESHNQRLHALFSISGIIGVWYYTAREALCHSDSFETGERNRREGKRLKTETRDQRGGRNAKAINPAKTGGCRYHEHGRSVCAGWVVLEE